MNNSGEATCSGNVLRNELVTSLCYHSRWEKNDAGTVTKEDLRDEPHV
jgi:hypothetical protein